MGNLFQEKIFLKTSVLIAILGILLLPGNQHLFPENRNSMTPFIPDEPGSIPEPASQDTMTYGQFRKIEDRRQSILIAHEYSNNALGRGTETAIIGVRRVLIPCDSCAGRPPDDSSFQNFLVLPGYYLDPNYYCSSWNGNNYVSGHGDPEMKKAPFRYSYSNYSNRFFDRKGTVLIPITKKTYTFIFPFLLVLSFGYGLFLIYFYFFIPLKILLRIAAGGVFADRNIRQLTWLVWALIAPTFIVLALKYLLAGLFRNELAAWVHVSFLSAFESSATPFFSALIVLAIIIAFKKGQALQKEQDLTI